MNARGAKTSLPPLPLGGRGRGWGWRRAADSLIAASALLLAAAACEERVIYRHPMLGGLPGSEAGMAVTGPKGEYIDPRKVKGDKITIENPDGSKTLIAHTGRHLMIHIYNCLQADDADLFTAQVLSTRTKNEYAERGLDPKEAFATLRERSDDVMKLFRAMPMGEFTPGVFIRPVGDAKRIALTGGDARDLQWSGFDMVMEKGNWKLRWFVEPETH